MEKKTCWFCSFPWFRWLNGAKASEKSQVRGVSIASWWRMEKPESLFDRQKMQLMMNADAVLFQSVAQWQQEVSGTVRLLEFTGEASAAVNHPLASSTGWKAFIIKPVHSDCNYLFLNHLVINQSTFMPSNWIWRHLKAICTVIGKQELMELMKW